MVERTAWTCPGCSKIYAVPSTDGLTRCPACQRQLRNRSLWRMAIAACGALVLVTVAAVVWINSPSADERLVLQHFKDGPFTVKVKRLWKSKTIAVADVQKCVTDCEAEFAAEFSAGDAIDRAGLTARKLSCRELLAHPNAKYMRAQLSAAPDRGPKPPDLDTIFVLDDKAVLTNVVIHYIDCKAFDAWVDRHFPL